MNKDIKTKYLYTAFAPKNMTYKQFKDMIDKDPNLLNDIGGKFSTFDSELAKTKKSYKNKKISANDLRNKLKDSMNPEVTEQRAQEYAEIYADIISHNRDILFDAWTFDTLNTKQRKELATKIIDEINMRFGIKEKVEIWNIKHKIQQPNTEILREVYKKIFIKLSNKLAGTNYKDVDWNGYYDNKHRIVMLSPKNFFRFIGVLSHEYGHFIDKKYPDLGMLGSQIANYGEKIYSSIEGDNIYKSNPTEVSSFKIGYTVEKHLQKVMTDQAKQAPDLYAKALKKLIAHAQVEMAALRVKNKKELNKISVAEQKFNDIKTKIFDEISNGKNIKDVSPQEIQSCAIKLSNNPQATAAMKEINDIKTRITPYTQLEEYIDKCKDLLRYYQTDTETFNYALSVGGIVHKE